MEKYIVENDNILYDYLRSVKKGSKNNIKSLLLKKFVKVNGKIKVKYDYKVYKGDVIEISQNFINNNNLDIKIIYEDNDILVVDKKAGILTINTEKCDKSLYRLVSSYVKKQNKNNKIFIVHRLDKDTSGLVLFAKNISMKNYLQSSWKKTKRLYKAVVHGSVKDKDTLKFKLKENKFLYTYVSNDGEESITKYTKISQNDNYSYVDIEILTGKKNQIRASFSHIGNPLVGDKKYGIKDTSNHMLLHAYRLEININGKKLTFKSDVPKYFNKYIL